jgi:hypothetical protein
VGASSNIIEASMHALIDSIEYGLVKQGVTLAPGPAGRSAEKPASVKPSLRPNN